MTNLAQLISRKHVELARRRVRQLEILVEERRAIVEELRRNGWASTQAEQALAEAEASLGDRRARLERKLLARPQSR